MEEEAKLWYSSDYDGLELLRARYITHTFDLHFHEEFAIGVIEQGAMNYYAGKTTEVFHRSDIVVINPRQIHYGHANTRQGWTYRMFYPSLPLMNQIAAEISAEDITEPYFPTHLLSDQPLANLLWQAHTIMEQSCTKLERESYLRLALGQLVMKYAVHRPQPTPLYQDDRAIQKICDYLQTHYAENVSLNDLSALVNFSPFHLLRLFRAQTGLPPHKYLTQLRIEAAKKLLSKGCPIKQVAMDTGFTDQSHLTRRFKRMVGVTPGQYVGLV